MHTVRRDPTRLQPCRRVRGRKNNTRFPTQNPEEPIFCGLLVLGRLFVQRAGDCESREKEIICRVM